MAESQYERLRLPTCPGRSEHRLVACTPSGFETRCLARCSGVQLRWVHDREVYVPARAHNGAQYFNALLAVLLFDLFQQNP